MIWICCLLELELSIAEDWRLFLQEHRHPSQDRSQHQRLNIGSSIDRERIIIDGTEASSNRPSWQAIHASRYCTVNDKVAVSSGKTINYCPVLSSVHQPVSRGYDKALFLPRKQSITVHQPASRGYSKAMFPGAVSSRETINQCPVLSNIPPVVDAARCCLPVSYRETMNCCPVLSIYRQPSALACVNPLAPRGRSILTASLMAGTFGVPRSRRRYSYNSKHSSRHIATSTRRVCWQVQIPPLSLRSRLCLPLSRCTTVAAAPQYGWQRVTVSESPGGHRSGPSV